MTFHELLGVAGSINPWTFPTPRADWGLGPALAAASRGSQVSGGVADGESVGPVSFVDRINEVLAQVLLSFVTHDGHDGRPRRKFVTESPRGNHVGA